MRWNNQGQLPLLLGLVVLLGLSTGCRTYQQENKTAKYWQQGNIAAAEKEITETANRRSNTMDAVVLRLEQGSVLRAAGKFEESNAAFELAAEKIDRYAQEAKVKVGNEAGAMLTTQANLPYTGRAYDGIMLNTYRALNFLALGEPEKAGPEIIRAYQRQQDAVEENKRRIENAQEEEAKSKEKAKVEKARKDPKFQSQLATNNANLEQLKVYADYVNPLTVFLDAVYFLHYGAGGSDLERARKSLERVTAFIGDHPYLQSEMEMQASAVNGVAPTPTTYVLFETGRAPERGQIRIDVPIIVSRVSYVGVAVPKLEFQGNYLSSLQVAANGTNYPTALLSSMDSVVGLDFKNEFPTILTKTIISTITKAVASYAANEAARQSGGDMAGLFMQIGTAVYQASVNVADTRTWTTLPKEFQFARFPTPADRKIELRAPGGGATHSVDLGEGKIHLVQVKSITANGPLIIKVSKLK
jgi:hypothetical protein